MTTPSIEDAIDKLWECSGHGTRRIDIEKAFAAGAETMRARCVKVCDGIDEIAARRGWKHGTPTDCATEIRAINLTPASTSPHTPT